MSYILSKIFFMIKWTFYFDAAIRSTIYWWFLIDYHCKCWFPEVRQVFLIFSPWKRVVTKQGLYIRGKVFKNEPKNSFKFFKGCLPQILLGRFLNTLPHILHLRFYLQMVCNLSHVAHTMGWKSNCNAFYGLMNLFSEDVFL